MHSASSCVPAQSTKATLSTETSAPPSVRSESESSTLGKKSIIDSDRMPLRKARERGAGGAEGMNHLPG